MVLMGLIRSVKKRFEKKDRFKSALGEEGALEIDRRYPPDKITWNKLTYQEKKSLSDAERIYLKS